MPNHPFRIDEDSLNILNGELAQSEDADRVRHMLDGFLRDGTPIVVTDEHGHEVGRITQCIGDRYVWERRLTP